MPNPGSPEYSPAIVVMGAGDATGGAIDTPWIARNFPERHALKDRDGILNPDDIAEAYWQLHRQPRSAWTLELDLRPWMEPF